MVQLEKFAWKPLPEAIQKSRTPAPVETALGRDRTPVERFLDAVAPRLLTEMSQAIDMQTPNQVGKSSILRNNLFVLAWSELQ